MAGAKFWVNGAGRVDQVMFEDLGRDDSSAEGFNDE